MSCNARYQKTVQFLLLLFYNVKFLCFRYCSHECQRLDWSTHSLHCDIIISSHLKAHPSEVQQSVQSMNNHRKLTILYDTKSYDQEQIITAEQQQFNDDCNSSFDIDR